MPKEIPAKKMYEIHLLLKGAESEIVRAVSYLPINITIYRWAYSPHQALYIADRLYPEYKAEWAGEVVREGIRK